MTTDTDGSDLDGILGFDQRVAIVSVVSFVLTTIPLAFVEIHPWSADSLSNDVPVARSLTGGHVPYAELRPSFITGMLTGVLSSLVGVDPATVLSLVPQAIFAVGIFAFAFFVRDFTDDDATAFWAAVTLGTYGPTVYWVSQGVRESYGLAFLPWIVWGIWYYVERPSIWTWVPLAIGTTILVITHHWTSFVLILGTGPIMLWSAYRGNRPALVAWSTVVVVFVFYWTVFNFIVRVLVLKAVAYILPSVVYTASTGSVAGSSGGGGSGGLLESIASLMVFPRPPQTFISIVLLAVLATVGVVVAYRRGNDRVATMAFVAGALVMVFPPTIPLGSSFLVYDPLRVVEFLVFPGSIAAGYAISTLQESVVTRNRVMTAILLVLFVGSAVVFYPPAYYSGHHFEPGDSLYDIRGDKFWATEGDLEAIEYAEERGYQLQSPGVSTINAYSRNRLESGRCAIWVTPSVRRIQSVNATIAAPLDIDGELVRESTSEGSVVYSNDRGKLYLLPENDPCWETGGPS